MAPLVTGASLEKSPVCHCGDFVPLGPLQPGSQESTELVQNVVWHLLAAVDLRSGLQAADAPFPAPPPVFSSEQLQHNYKQVVLCVWRT